MTRAEKVAKLEMKKKELAEIMQNSEQLQEQYIDVIDNDPKYSLQVDPQNIYGMSDLQKTFIGHYVNFKNVNTAAELTGIDQDTAKQFFIAFSSQQEIRRINLALYQRQFCNKLLTIDQIGGYLTSLLTDEFVPIGDQLKTSDKLRVVTMLIELNKLKAEGLQNPEAVMNKSFDVEIKDLSLQTIRRLIKTNEENQSKPEISQLVGDELTPEESAYLSTLPTKDLLDLIDQTEGGKKDESK